MAAAFFGVCGRETDRPCPLRQLTELGILFLFSANFIRSVGMLRLSQELVTVGFSKFLSNSTASPLPPLTGPLPADPA
jgi:hypothetical protein